MVSELEENPPSISRLRRRYRLILILPIASACLIAISSITLDNHFPARFQDVINTYHEENIFTGSEGLSTDPSVPIVPTRPKEEIAIQPNPPPKILTERFRDNLDPSRKYVTSFVSAGITNQIISLLHLIEISLHTRNESQSNKQDFRTPVLPPFAPIHVNRLAGFIHFGDVFDVPRLSADLGIEVLEWRDLKLIPKNENVPMDDELGCWSLVFTQFPQYALSRPWPWHGDVPGFLGLDVSWTPIPSESLITHLQAQGGWPADLAFLSQLGEGEMGDKALSESKPGKPQQGIEPDSQLLCFDFLFYTSFAGSKSMNLKEESLLNAVDSIGSIIHFTPKLENIALEVLRGAVPDAFKPESSDSSFKFPPYIAVHIRRGDFEQYCTGPFAKMRDKSSCFTPLSVFAEAVESVRSELLRSPSSSNSLTETEIRNLPVFIFSDEPKRTNVWYINRFHRADGISEAWWNIVYNDLKWISIDHESPSVNTEKRWGYWYPNLVDAVLMSNAVGFVGTAMSTYSLLAGKRVERWKGGPMRLVRPVIERQR